THGRDRNNRAGQERPHEQAAFGKETDDGLDELGHFSNSQLAYMVKDISSSKPWGGSVSATSSGIGGNWISSTDCKQTLANDSFELFSATLRFCGWPFRSTENTRRNVPILTKSRCLLT